MMKRTAILLLAVFLPHPSSLSAKGVKPPKKFGDVSKEELAATVCPIDSSAAAYYLFDWGEAYFDFNTGEMMLRYQARIKIVNSDGFSEGNVTLPFRMNDPIKKLKAATYNLVDGKVVATKVDNSMIFNEKVSGDQRQLKISFPEVREGSVIEYTYLRSAGNLYHLVPWVFQDDIPVLYSEFNLRIPDWLQYKFIQEGEGRMSDFSHWSFVDRGTVQSTEYHWVMRELPALREEPYMPDPSHFLARLSFELTAMIIPGRSYQEIARTWEGLERDLRKSEMFWKVPDQWAFLRDSVTHLTGGRHDLTALEALRAFIGRHVKWDGNYSMFASGTARHTYKAGSGNSSDINMMLLGLMRLAGFEAWPVILCTRDHGKITRYDIPFLSKFNYTAVWTRAGDHEWVVDATEPLLPATYLPVHCLNGKGRLIGNTPRWIPLTPKKGFIENILYNLELSDDGSLKANIKTTRKGYPAFEIREYVRKNGLDKMLEKRKQEHPSWHYQSWALHHENDPLTPLIEETTCTLQGQTEDMGDVLLFDPLIDPEWKENPFKSEKREYPIDFLAPREKKIIINCTLPEGYSVEEMPKSLRISTPDKMISYTYMATHRGNMLQIMSSINIRKAFFRRKDYPEIRNFFNEVLAKQAEQIILKKTEL